MEEKRKVVKLGKKNIVAVIIVCVLIVAFALAVGIIPEKPIGERIILSADSTEESYGSTLKGSPVGIGNLVGVVSGGNFMISDDKGEIKTSENFVLTDPIIHSSGNYTIGADYKGNVAKLYEKGEVETTVNAEGKIISVVTNANGFFAIATKEAGYNAVITVYRKNGEAIYRYRITENTFVDMDISANNRKLVVTEAAMQGGIVGSNVVLAEFNRENAESVFYTKGNIYVAVHFNRNGSFVCLGNEQIDIFRADGTKSCEIEYGGRKLLASDIGTDDMIALGFEAGADEEAGVSSVEIYDKNGKQRGKIQLEDEIEHIGVNGRYAALSHGDKTDIVNGECKIKLTHESTSPVKYAMPFDNGKSVVVFSGGNTLILK